MAADKQPTERFIVVAGKTETATPIFSVLVKRTYDIKPNQAATRSEHSLPLNEMDIYYDHGDPEWSTVQYETDLLPYKLQTDVVLIGKAYAPQGKPVEQMSVGIEVAGRRKVLRVIGDRHCIFREHLPPAFSDPIPFTEIEIRYERAYGGKDI